MRTAGKLCRHLERPFIWGLCDSVLCGSCLLSLRLPRLKTTASAPTRRPRERATRRGLGHRTVVNRPPMTALGLYHGQRRRTVDAMRIVTQRHCCGRTSTSWPRA